MGKRVLLLTILLVVILVGDVHAVSILATKHNLSATSGNAIRAVTEDQVCIFCHTPHNANPAVGLWNHVTNTSGYTIYASSSLDGEITQPKGATKLCLSCHDGTIGLGRLLGGVEVAMVGATMLTGSKSLGTDLRNDHPVSVAVQTSPAARDPEIVLNPTDPGIRYIFDAEGNQRVECTSCHDPHDNTYGTFLRKPNIIAGVGSQICIVCHEKQGWDSSAHRNSTKQYQGTSLRELACDACHSPHHSQSTVRLLNKNEEALCLECHGGSTRITAKDARAPFLLSYSHPVLDRSGLHDFVETGPINAGATRSQDRAPNAHAECEDCHGPHGVQGGRHIKGTSQIGSVLLGAWGLKPIYDPARGAYADPIAWEKVVFTDTTGPDSLEAYLCFKCHPEKAREFNPYNGSYHAVMAPVAPPKTSGYGTYINGWTATSGMTCSDCHGTNNTSSTVIQGPHGSAHRGILTKRFEPNTDMKEGQKGIGTGVHKDRNTNNDLCFDCHDRMVYGHKDGYEDNRNYRSGFADGTKENYHVEDHDGIACTACHTVHGSRDRALLTNFRDSSRGFPENRGSLLRVITWRSPTRWGEKYYCNHDCR